MANLNLNENTVLSGSFAEPRLSGDEKSDGIALFIKELFLTAEQDTPYEISEWCKSAFCKNVCAFLGVDVNNYRRKMLEASIKNHCKIKPVKPRNRTAEEELCREEDEELKYGPLFCYNNSAV